MNRPPSTMRRAGLAASVFLLLLVAFLGVGLPWWFSRGIFLSVGLKSSVQDVCQIFWAENPGDPFTEKKSRTFRVFPGGVSKTCLLPAKHIDRLRVDLGTGGGTMRASRIQLSGCEERVLDWHDFSCLHDIGSMEVDAKGAVDVQPSGSDPFAISETPIGLAAATRVSCSAAFCLFLFAFFLWWPLAGPGGFLADALQTAVNGGRSSQTSGRGDVFLTLLCAAVGVQIALFAIWAVCNAGVKPSFGDATEYVNLSESLRIDEYRPILYPLVIRAARGLESLAHLPYQFYVYLFQFSLSFLSMLFTACVAESAFHGGPLPKPSRRHFLLAAAVSTFPLVGFMSFAGMSDSIALSATVLFLDGFILLRRAPKPSGKLAALVFFPFVVGSLVRGDRLWLFLAFALLFTLLAAVRDKALPKNLLFGLVVAGLAFTAVSSIDNSTQSPGCWGRPKTTFDFVLLDRVVWPHMSECYHLFPPEVRQVVSRADAENFDQNNNNVMYIFAKKMNRVLGEDNAQALYRTMAKTVFRAQPVRTLREITHDVLKVCFAPFFQLADVYRRSCHASGPCIEPYCYNPRCFATNTPCLERLANAVPLHLFAALFLVATIRAICHKPAFRPAALLFLAVFFGFSLLLALFYGLGDGAHPNSRYSIIVDVSWLFALFQLAGWFPSRSAQPQNTSAGASVFP